MKELALRLLWRSLLCLALTWMAWRGAGVFGLCVSLAIWGLALARPLIDLAGELRHGMRAATWGPLEGRHFVFRGTPVQVLEDADRRRWVRAADVRRCVGFTASDGALALSYPSGWQSMGHPAEPHFSDAALLVHLGKESSPGALKFRQWVEREVAFPARRQRERLGVKVAAPDAPRHD